MDRQEQAEAELAWQARAIEYARKHPAATAMRIADKLGNPRGLTVMPLAREAIWIASQEAATDSSDGG